MRKFVISTTAALMIALPAVARDKVDHIACIGGDSAIDDVVRIVAHEVVNEQQVNNVDSLWDSNGNCHRQSVNRMFATDPFTATQEGVMGGVEVGGKILLIVPSQHPERRGFVWWVVLDRIGYFPNQIVNGGNSSDQLAWKVSEIYKLRNYGLPYSCVSRMRIVEDARLLYIAHNEYSRCANFLRSF